MPYAVIKSGGKQFVVQEGQTIRVPSIQAEPGGSVELPALLTSSDGTKIGTPLVDAKVSATVLEHGRKQKMIVFKKKRRKQYKRTIGHRQGYSTVRIDSIG